MKVSDVRPHSFSPMLSSRLAMNICEHLTVTARIVPENEAIRFEGRSLTYAQLDQLTLAAGTHLQQAGIQPGDRVAIMLANVPAFPIWYFAALRIGAIAVSLSTRAAVSEVTFLIDDCGAKCLVADQTTLASMKGQLPTVITSTFTASDWGDACNGQPLDTQDSAESGWIETAPNDPAVILYTSGTTGFAKGATLSHLNVRSNVTAFNHLCQMQANDRILLAVPLFHCFGQNALLNSALNAGAALVLQRRFDLNESKRLIADEQVTQLYGVPMMFQLFLNSCTPADLSSVNYCFSAAAPLPIQVSRQWQQTFGMPIHEGYGLTETSPFASYNHRLKFVPGSIGTPIDCVEMKVVDTETGAACPVGEPGEIVVRGPNVMLGYWNREEDTKTAIRDGWFHSGDIGRIDEQGYFYILDRVKDMITVGGLKVYPAEVERVLLEHPAVTQAAVVGIDDDVFGEQVVAFVVLSAEVKSDEDVLAQLRQHTKQHLANYKVPRVIRKIDELPRNPSGKILKRELREFDLSDVGVTADEEHSATDNGERAVAATEQPEPPLRALLTSTHATGHRNVATRFVQNLVRVVTDAEQLPDPEDRFLDAGLDSLMIVELSHRIRAELGPGHDIPATLVFDYPRITDLGEFLVAALRPPNDGGLDASLDSVRQEVGTAHEDVRQQVAAMSEDEALEELLKELGSD